MIYLLEPVEPIFIDSHLIKSDSFILESKKVERNVRDWYLHSSEGGAGSPDLHSKITHFFGKVIRIYLGSATCCLFLQENHIV